MDFSEYLKLLSKTKELNIPYQIDLTKYELLSEEVKAHINRVGKEIYNKTKSW